MQVIVSGLPHQPVTDTQHERTYSSGQHWRKRIDPDGGGGGSSSSNDDIVSSGKAGLEQELTVLEFDAVRVSRIA